MTLLVGEVHLMLHSYVLRMLCIILKNNAPIQGDLCPMHPCSHAPNHPHLITGHVGEKTRITLRGDCAISTAREETAPCGRFAWALTLMGGEKVGPNEHSLVFKRAEDRSFRDADDIATHQPKLNPEP